MGCNGHDLQASEVARLLKVPHAALYICGDGAHMAHDVHAALLEALKQQYSMTQLEAENHLSSMHKHGSYVRDIWS